MPRVTAFIMSISTNIFLVIQIISKDIILRLAVDIGYPRRRWLVFLWYSSREVLHGTRYTKEKKI